MLPLCYAAEEDEELDEPVGEALVLEPLVELAGAAGAADGAAGALVPAFSEGAGVVVLSVPDSAGVSADSFPESGFILSE